MTQDKSASRSERELLEKAKQAIHDESASDIRALESALAKLSRERNKP